MYSLFSRRDALKRHEKGFLYGKKDRYDTRKVYTKRDDAIRAKESENAL